MKGKEIQKNKINIKGICIGLLTILTLVAVVIGIVLFSIKMQKVREYQANPEIARSIEYERVKEGEEKDTGSEYVEFDAFFLRDLDGDNEADEVRGTCRRIGEQDTLYLDLNVLTKGELQDGVITINSKNMYFQTTIVEDGEIKGNYISNNTKKIELKTIQNGTQKLITGIVRSGDYSSSYRVAEAIGNDISKYSKINSIKGVKK